MAIRIIRCCCPYIMIPEGQIRRRITKATMVENSSRQVKIASIPLKKFPRVKKVFEDQIMGIVGYVDESGELIYEGCDEGPRYGQRSPEHKYAQRQRQQQTVVDIKSHQVIRQHN